MAYIEQQLITFQYTRKYTARTANTIRYASVPVISRLRSSIDLEWHDHLTSEVYCCCVRLTHSPSLNIAWLPVRCSECIWRAYHILTSWPWPVTSWNQKKQMRYVGCVYQIWNPHFHVTSFLSYDDTRLLAAIRSPSDLHQNIYTADCTQRAPHSICLGVMEHFLSEIMRPCKFSL